MTSTFNDLMKFQKSQIVYEMTEKVRTAIFEAELDEAVA